MLRNWTEVLPLFVHRWYANKHCKRQLVGERRVAIPRPGVMIEINDKDFRHVYIDGKFVGTLSRI
jgi:hypothetical protein